MKNPNSNIIAALGTTLFMLLVFLLLWLLTISSVQPEQEDGIEVAFGEIENAGEYMAQQSEAVPVQTPPAAPQRPSAPSDNDLLTQEDEASIALRKEQEEAEKARRQAEAERLQRQREEQARLEAERKAREAAEAAERTRREEAIAKANELGSLFGTNTAVVAASGDGQGEGQKGNPIGHGSSGGNSWTLSGRGIRGTLPQPANTFNQDGKVVVQIRVNAAGQVISATIKGGDVSDKQTQQLALEAARKAKFTEGDHDQIGTITYIFKLN